MTAVSLDALLAPLRQAVAEELLARARREDAAAARALLDTLAYLYRACGRPGAERLAWTDLPQPTLDGLTYADVRVSLYPCPADPGRVIP